MSHIETLADEPHSLLDREAHARARDDVIAMFTELGYQPEIHAHPMKLQQFPGVEKLDGVNAESIVVRIPGASDRTLMMMAHYDSAFSSESTATLEPGTSHGAADDGYGVATIVETSQAAGRGASAGQQPAGRHHRCGGSRHGRRYQRV